MCLDVIDGGDHQHKDMSLLFICRVLQYEKCQREITIKGLKSFHCVAHIQYCGTWLYAWSHLNLSILQSML